MKTWKPYSIRNKKEQQETKNTRNWRETCSVFLVSTRFLLSMTCKKPWASSHCCRIECYFPALPVTLDSYWFMVLWQRPKSGPMPHQQWRTIFDSTKRCVSGAVFGNAASHSHKRLNAPKCSYRQVTFLEIAMKSPYKLDMVDKAKYGSQMFTILFNKLTGVEIHWICGIPGYTQSHDRAKAGQSRPEWRPATEEPQWSHWKEQRLRNLRTIRKQ